MLAVIDSMKPVLKFILALIAANLVLGGGTARSLAGLDARMMRFPDVSRSNICFVYAGDIWVAPKQGGAAYRLSSPRGEETFPRFSPDGTRIAFTGNYDGNSDIYVVPVAGGVPARVTFHGAPDRMLDWHPDGKSLLFASTRTSEKDRFNQLYLMPADGGLPEKLPVPYGEFGMISGDGGTLAYVPVAIDFRTWKRYRGGMNPAIWLFNLKDYKARNLTGNDAANTQPMWYGSTLYFLSDRDKNKRFNIWAYDTQKNQLRQVTRFEQLDVHFPSIGPEDLVFECGGRLYVLNLATEQYQEALITVVTDRATLKPRLAEVSRYAREADLSPTGKRVVFEARGELFTVPRGAWSRQKPHAVLRCGRTFSLVVARWQAPGVFQRSRGRIRANPEAGGRVRGGAGSDPARPRLPVHADVVAGREENRVH